MNTTMKKSETKELLDTIGKLERYCNQYSSRSVNIGVALGNRGLGYLNKIIELRDSIEQQDKKIKHQKPD